MPTTTEIEAAYTRKIQLEQFEPISHAVTITVEVEDGDDPDDVYDEAAEKAEDMVERQLAARVAEAKIQSEQDDDAE